MSDDNHISSADAKPKSLFWILAFLLAVGLTIAARLYELTKFGLWMDEVFSVRIARLGWAELFEQTVKDGVHPPLFYLLLKLWTIAGGESLLWLKLFPVGFAIGSVGVLYLLCRKLSVSFSEYCIALIFISLNSYLTLYSQELRMYSLLSFLSLTSIWLFTKFLKDDSTPRLTPVFLVTVNLLLVFTHYFGWFTVLAEFLVVLFYDRSRLKSVSIQTIVVGICFLPWGMLVASAMANKGGLSQNLGWIDKPGLSAITQFLADMHGQLSIRHATTAGLIIFLPPGIIWFWQVVKGRERSDMLIWMLLGFVAALPIIAAFCVSQVIATSIWVDRYLIAAVVPYLLLMAISVSRMKNPGLRALFLTIMISWSVGAGAWNLLCHRSRVDWIGLSDTVKQRNLSDEAPDAIFVLEDWAEFPLQQLFAGEMEVHKVKSLSEIADREYWFVYRSTTWKDKTGPAEPIQGMGCSIEQERIDKLDNESVHLVLVNCRES